MFGDSGITLEYTINVMRPKRSTVTEIPMVKLKEFPEYQHNMFIEEEFIKTIMPFENPTTSEING
jgi:hypothetical protein